MVVAQVLDTVLNSGSRFLKKAKGSSDQWVQMTRHEAHGKVGHAIRDTLRNLGKDKAVEAGSRTFPGPPTGGNLRRYHSAGAIKKTLAKTDGKVQRSRSLADVIAAFKPEIADITESQNEEFELIDNLRLSIQSASSQIIDEVLKTVHDLDLDFDMAATDADGTAMDTFDDTPLPMEVPSSHAMQNSNNHEVTADSNMDPIDLTEDDLTPLHVSSNAAAEGLGHDDLSSVYEALFQ
ncbi:MAG: hypothetical protein SGILL_006504 [Bacillariaceae sp.]